MARRLGTIVAVALGALAPVVARAQGAVLVKDIWAGQATPVPLEATELGRFGTAVFFQGEDSHGLELWKTDGTEAGTALVRDINPGAGHSVPDCLMAVGTTLFFAAADNSAGRELWKTDGTAAGTVRVKDIRPGIEQSGIAHPVAMNGLLFFVANDGVHGHELWRSDGTAAGTVMVKDIRKGPDSGVSEVMPWLTVVNGRLFFTADDGVHDQELWTSDGTEAGTVLIDIQPFPGTGSAPSDLVDFNGTLLLRASGPLGGAELWKSDGTPAGTVLVKHWFGGPGNPHYLTVMGDHVYFAGRDAEGTELWKSDGTEAGTVLVKDIHVGPDASLPWSLEVVGQTLFFAAFDATSAYELWKSDGTEAGTVLVKDIHPGYVSSEPDDLTAFGTRLLFSAYVPALGRELYVSDGTEAGTVLLSDIHPGAASTFPRFITPLGSHMLFTEHNPEDLWRTDGTEAGTVTIRLTATGGSGFAGPAVALGQDLLFVGTEPANGKSLWRSDGTTQGTDLVKAIEPASPALDVELVASGGRAYFVADDSGGHGVELWTSDGTEAGTIEVADIAAGPVSSWPTDLTDVNGTLFFSAYQPGLGAELWKSDGTAAGTVLVKDIEPGPASSGPEQLAHVEGTLFFKADSFIVDELWKSDGTTAGTVFVKSGWQQTSLRNLTAVGSTLFFTAYELSSGYELWKSDGTTAGTTLVKDINPGDAHAFPSFLTAVGGTLFFVADDGVHGLEMWQSDGTEAGTVMVKDIYPGATGPYPRYLTASGGTLFFTATDGVAGTELWKSDGTEAGTIMVKDVFPGPGASNPYNLRSALGRLAFAADDGVAGAELWETDGTEVGTVRVADIHPGLGASDPQHLVATPGRLYFAADDGLVGRELWLRRAPAFSVDDVTVSEGDRGTVRATFTVTLAFGSTSSTAVHFATSDATATAGTDYVAVSGDLTFAPGASSRTVTVSVNGDRDLEGDETFNVDLQAPVNAVLADGTAVGTIENDDPSLSSHELGQGSRQWRTMDASVVGQPGVELFRIGQHPRASYEVVVDGASGDVAPPSIELLAADGATVLQSGLATGTGGSVSLRWRNAGPYQAYQYVRVRSGGCTTDCGADDVYRLRTYETTARLPRFNNGGTQVTVLILQNPTSRTISGTAHFWSVGGTLMASHAFALLPLQSTALDTSVLLPNTDGSMTVAHDGGYGELVGKTAVLEPATGFSFDTPLQVRPR